MSKVIAEDQNAIIEDLTEELNEKTAEPAPVEATEKKERKGHAIPEGMVGVSQLAEQLGTNGRTLRIFLRKHFRDMGTEKGKTYTWPAGSPELQSIIDAYNAPKAPRANAKKINKEADAAQTAEAVTAPVEAVPEVDLSDVEDVVLD
jgi:hypothetical protein